MKVKLFTLMVGFLVMGSSVFAQHCLTSRDFQAQSIKAKKVELTTDKSDKEVVTSSAATKTPGDITVLIANCDASTQVAANLGCEFDGTNYWITGRDDALGHGIYQVAPDGTLLNTYLQGTTSTWGMRDMAYDAAANMLYAGDDNGFYSIDPTDGTVTTVFSGQSYGTIRALAWDGTNFWTKSFADPLYKFAPDGTLLETYTIANSAYGMCYDPIEDCLWLHASGASDNELVQVAMDGTLTGTVVAVTGSGAAGSVGGCFYDFGAAVPGDITIGVLYQGTPDVIWGVDMGPSADPAAPAAAENFTATPDAGGALTVALAWDNPSLTVEGNALTELTSIDVYSDEDGFTTPIYTNASPTIGGAETYSATVTAGGVRTFQVVGTNTAGTGIPVSVAAFVGVDVEVTSTDLPATAVLDQVITPTVTVTNNGVGDQTFDVTLTDGTYSETMSATALAAGASTDLVFPDWTATPAGTSTFTITAADPGGDIDLTNNEITHDVNIFAGCEHTLNLADSYGDGWNGNTISVSVNGTAQLANVTIASGDAASFPFFAETGDDIEVEFFAEGGWPEECSWEVIDGLGGSLLTGAGPGASVQNVLGYCGGTDTDMTTLAVSPVGNYAPDVVVTPSITVKNLGPEVATYDVDVVINDGSSDVYTATVNVTTAIAQGAEVTIDMDTDWTTANGNYTITGTVTATGDVDPANDSFEGAIVVDDAPPYDAEGYVINTADGQFSSITMADGAQTPIAAYATDPFPMATEWDGSFLYVVHSDASLAKLLPDGTTDPIGTISGVTGTPTGLAWDEANSVMYVVILDGSNAPQLATLDLGTGAATLVGVGSGMIIGIDFADDGYIYGPSLDDDNLYQIDPATGATTVIGALGVDINYGQDVSFYGGALYTYTVGAAYNYGVYDITTGAFVAIAPTPGDAQIATLTILGGTPPPPTYEVVFGVYGDGGGTVTAEVDGTAISSGDMIAEGSTVVFTAVPDAGYELVDWWYNGASTGITGLVVEETDLSSNIEVLAEFALGVEELAAAGINVYPNPSNGTFNVEVNGTYEVSVMNIAGEVVYTTTVTDNATIDLTEQSAGIYVMQLRSDNEVVNHRIMIK